LQPALVVVAGVVAALHVVKLIPAMPHLQAQLGLSLVQAGFLLSVVQFGGMSLGLAMGLLADSLGPRRSMAWGLMGLAAASAVGAFATGAVWLLALRVIEGFAYLITITSAPALIRQVVPPQRVSKWMGIWGSFMPVATALALLLGPGLMLALGWQAVWGGMALLSAAMAWGLQRAVAQQVPSPAMQRPQGLVAGLLDRLRLTLRHLGPWLLGACFGFYSLQWLAVIGFLPTVYAQAGVGLAASTVLTALAAAANIVGNVASGRLLGAGWRPQSLLWMGYAVMGLASLGLYLEWPLAVPGPWRFGLQFVSVALFSAVGGLIPGTLFALGVRLAPSESTVSTTVGWMQQCSAMGQFAGPPLVAWVASQLGGWHWAWIVTVVSASLGAGVVWRVARLLSTTAARQAAH
jgi:MFS family permease